MKCVLAIFLASVTMLCESSRANGETLSGSLVYTPSILDSDDGIRVIGDKWVNYSATMTWEVTNEDNVYAGFPWKYTYSFKLTNSGKLQGGISHVIIECSEAMGANDIIGVSGGAVLETNPVALQEVASGNFNMPESVWGIRFNPSVNPESEFEMTWSFWCNREPVWGDFYIKDGNNYAYNYNMTSGTASGFLASDTDPDLSRDSDPVGLYHILRPDSQVPEPSSAILLATFIVVFFAYHRREMIFR